MVARKSNETRSSDNSQPDGSYLSLLWRAPFHSTVQSKLVSFDNPKGVSPTVIWNWRELWYIKMSLPKQQTPNPLVHQNQNARRNQSVWIFTQTHIAIASFLLWHPNHHWQPWGTLPCGAILSQSYTVWSHSLRTFIFISSQYHDIREGWKSRHHCSWEGWCIHDLEIRNTIECHLVASLMNVAGQ